MKNRPNIFQSHPHSGATAFGDFCTQSDEKGFNVLPGDIGALWLFKNGFQCFAVFAVHDKIISHIDTIYKSFHCDAQRCTSPAAVMARLQTHHSTDHCKSHPVPPRRRRSVPSNKTYSEGGFCVPICYSGDVKGLKNPPESPCFFLAKS